MRTVTRRSGHRRHRALGARAVTVAFLVALVAVVVPAQARPQDDAGGASATREASGAGFAVPADVPGAEDVRDALSREIARMKAEIAGIGRLARWQADLERIARTDRAEALRQRRPMSDCLESALAPVCDELTGLFRPEEGDGNAAADETGTEVEGAR